MKLARNQTSRDADYSERMTLVKSNRINLQLGAATIRANHSFDLISENKRLNELKLNTD